MSDPLREAAEAALEAWDQDTSDGTLTVAMVRLRAALSAVSVPTPLDALLRAVEEVDSAWNDEGDHLNYHEELAERLLTLRREYGEYDNAAPQPVPEEPTP